MPSLSAAERRNPPPRQKACAACTKAKRRCDFASPCKRCQLRRIPCLYPSRKYPSNETTSPACVAWDSASSQAGAGGEQQPVLSVYSVDSGYDGADHLDPAAMIGNESGVDLLDQQWMIHDGLPSGDWAQTDLTPPLYQDFDYYNKLITDKMQYAIDAIKSAPRTMITETATPWSHPQLYRDHMPTSIRDAHAACALYMAKTNINGPIIMRSVETYAQSLLAAPSPSTPPERLAHTHALLLYQIIRLLDGDMISRTSAERDIPALEASAYALLAHVNFETPLLPPPALDLPIHPLPPTTRFWERWAFEESTRRTLLFSSFFLQTYRAVSGRQLLPCDGKLFLEHTLTMSAHLWGARTAAEFAASWRDREHFVVANAQFDSFIRDAKADDVDQFGRILISALMGIEEADAWLSVRGGSLR